MISEYECFCWEGQYQDNRTFSATLLVLYFSVIHLVDTQLYLGQSGHGIIMLWKEIFVSERETALFNYGCNISDRENFTAGICNNDSSCLHSESFATKLVSLLAQGRVSHSVLVSTWLYDFLTEGPGHVWTIFKILRIPFSHCRALVLPGGGKEHAMQSCSGALQKYILIWMCF